MNIRDEERLLENIRYALNGLYGVSGEPQFKPEDWSEPYNRNCTALWHTIHALEAMRQELLNPNTPA